MRHIGTGASGSCSVPALYSDNEMGDEFEDDIVQELRECHGHTVGSSHSTFRMASKELSSSSGFSSPSIPDPPPPPRCKCNNNNAELRMRISFFVPRHFSFVKG